MDYTAFLTPALGSTGIVVLVVLMVLRGHLVPRSTLDMVREDKNLQIETWRTAYQHTLEVVQTQREQIAMLMEAAQTTQHVIESLPEAARLNSEEGRRALASSSEE